MFTPSPCFFANANQTCGLTLPTTGLPEIGKEENSNSILYVYIYNIYVYIIYIYVEYFTILKCRVKSRVQRHKLLLDIRNGVWAEDGACTELSANCNFTVLQCRTWTANFQTTCMLMTWCDLGFTAPKPMQTFHNSFVQWKAWLHWLDDPRVTTGKTLAFLPRVSSTFILISWVTTRVSQARESLAFKCKH